MLQSYCACYMVQERYFQVNVVTTCTWSITYTRVWCVAYTLSFEVMFIGLVNKAFTANVYIVLTSYKDILIADSYQLSEQFCFFFFQVAHNVCHKIIDALASVTKPRHKSYYSQQLNSTLLWEKIKLWFHASKCKNACDKFENQLSTNNISWFEQIQCNCSVKFIFEFFPEESTFVLMWSMNFMTYIWKSNSAQLICLTARFLLSMCGSKQTSLLCLSFSIDTATVWHAFSWRRWAMFLSTYSLG